MAKFHRIHKETSSYSILKDAERYAREYEIDLNFSNEQCIMRYEDVNGEEQETHKIEKISQQIAKNRNASFQKEICNAPWQGVNYLNRQNDVDVTKEYFSWLKMWVTCPTTTVSEFFLMFYQLLATKSYLLIRSAEPIEDTRCRICKNGEEHVKHLLSNCSVLAKSVYKTRHDNALKCFVFSFLYHFGLIEKIPPWYSNKKVQPYMEGNNVKFWWVIPEYNGKENEEDRKTLRPDGKIMVDKEGEKYILLIEMTVPWTENRTEKFNVKHNKYMDIISNLKLDNPGYMVGQITLVMDVFGGFGKDLRENIGKVLKGRATQDSVIKNMQKSVISDLCNISRIFKIRTK